VHDEGLTGAPDPVIVDHARAESRVLVTMDKGIADIRADPATEHAGSILVRPSAGSGRQHVRETVMATLPEIVERVDSGSLAVLTERGLRIR
jgi:predicted nuclease of predicted toxin-antitoxin system